MYDYFLYGSTISNFQNVCAATLCHDLAGAPMELGIWQPLVHARIDGPVSNSTIALLIADKPLSLEDFFNLYRVFLRSPCDFAMFVIILAQWI